MNQRREYGAARKLGLLGVLAGSATLLAGCDVNPPENGFFKLLRFGWPMGDTPEAEAMGNFWVWVWVAAWIIGIAVWGLTIYSMVGFSAKKAKKAGKDEFPRQTAYNVPLELVLTIVPILIVMSLFFFTVQTQDKVTAMDKDPEVVVDVTAFQWNWKFGYANLGAEISPTGSVYEGRDEDRHQAAEAASVDPEDMKNANPIHGRSMGDLSYLNYNEIETLGSTEEVPVLVLPTNTPIEFRLASGDVSHSFWVPEFLFKRDTYAHPEANQQERSFQISEITEEGAFVGRCAEMCGTYHAMMNFEVRTVSPEAFEEYMQFRMDNPEAPNSEALASIGEEPYATSTSPFNSSREGTREGDNFVDASAKA